MTEQSTPISSASAKNSKPQTRNSIKSKPSTASDTSTKKNRWFRLGTTRSELPEFDHLLDIYWGGPERRITSLTLRIITVNAIALATLMVGTLFLGQYQSSLIESKLENFKVEVELISAALSEGATDSAIGLTEQQTIQMVSRFSRTLEHRILVFDKRGKMIADSSKLAQKKRGLYEHVPAKEIFFTIQVLKNMAGLILKIVPDKRVLPVYPEIDSQFVQDYPYANEALEGKISMSAWVTKEDAIFLSASAPVYRENEFFGTVLLTREGHDIKESVGEVWIGILKIFAVTLIITIMLSIYLSGVIANPLRKLAAAAEGVRKGKSKYTEIPDLSSRNDEIGELSIALREMTEALWDRMDAIEQFAADVSHELKNPLTSLKSAIETAAVVKKKADRDKLTEIIRHDIDRLDRLISDISHASRLDAELSREALQRINLKPVLNNLLDAYKDPLERAKQTEMSWQNSAKTNGFTITLDSNSRQDIYVRGLEGRLGQVFENILSNALTFSPKNGAVNIFVESEAKRVKITIMDQGPGIPENKLDTVFERFYSERPEEESYGSHSGLGLSICKQIITALGGKIYAENVKDGKGGVTGARFTVILNKA